MTSQDIRLECLKLAMPRDIANPDVTKILERAKAFEAFVVGAGHAEKAPAQQPMQLPHKPGQAQQPRHQR